MLSCRGQHLLSAFALLFGFKIQIKLSFCNRGIESCCIHGLTHTCTVRIGEMGSDRSILTLMKTLALV